MFQENLGAHDHLAQAYKSLCSAIKQKNSSQFSELIDKYPEVVHERDEVGETLLHVLVRHEGWKDKEDMPGLDLNLQIMLERLILAGADLGAKDSDDLTARGFASCGGRHGLVRELDRLEEQQELQKSIEGKQMTAFEKRLAMVQAQQEADEAYMKAVESAEVRQDFHRPTIQRVGDQSKRLQDCLDFDDDEDWMGSRYL